MEAQARSPERVTTFDTLFRYIAAAYGLHQAAEIVRAGGDEAWAAELHRLGQLFLQFATDDTAAIVWMNANAIVPAKDGLVH